MRDICNLCNSKEFDIIKSELRDDKLRFKVFRCAVCGHVQVLPRPTEEEDRLFYDENLQDKHRKKEINYEKIRINNLFDTDRHVRLIQSLRKDINSTILDIGAGYGFFVNELYNNRYKNVFGIEISKERREIAIDYGMVPIVDFDVNKPDRDIGKFDVVTLFHVLEHMAAPIIFLNNILNLIKPDGILICEVPNIRELLLGNSTEYNDFYWIRAHLNYFSRETLYRCIKSAGFNNVNILYEQRYGLINLCNWLSTGKPQIERPIFEICETYAHVESFYKEWLKSIERTDTMIAIACKSASSST